MQTKKQSHLKVTINQILGIMFGYNNETYPFSRIKYAKMQLAKILVRPTEERNFNAGLS